MPGESPYVAIIGGGPAGLIAAETLAHQGVRVVVFEHKRSVGRKFLLAGRGGLNITHSEPLDRLLARYGAAQQFLEPALRSFPPEAVRAWCADLGEETFVGTSERVFPESFRATPLLRAWLTRLEAMGVELATGHRWVGWGSDTSLEFETNDGTSRIEAPDATVFALGGASWPRVGSDGSWAAVFRDAGVTVTSLAPANCGVITEWSAPLVDRFAGQPIKNAIFRCSDQHARGDAVVIENGIEGGPIYALGPAIRSELAKHHSVVLQLDLHPDLDVPALTERLSRRRTKASVASWLRSAGVPPMTVALVRESTANQIPNDPGALAHLLKALPIEVRTLPPIDRAISTAGGVALDELNAQYMLSRRPGVFVAGEMLDWEAPTGGYLLQACFSTGVAAARGVLDWL